MVAARRLSSRCSCSRWLARLVSLGRPRTRCSPGATDSRLTNDNVAQTICMRGDTRTLRNISSVVKQAVYSEYGIPRGERHRYVIDHLIPLEVGGSNDIKNLWLQPKSGAQSTDAQDRVENDPHHRVCAGLTSLESAQQAFVIYRGGGTVPASSPQPSGPAPAGSSPAATGPTARCNDGTYSSAAQHRGACSHHGGVDVFYRSRGSRVLGRLHVSPGTSWTCIPPSPRQPQHRSSRHRGQLPKSQPRPAW